MDSEGAMARFDLLIRLKEIGRLWAWAVILATTLVVTFFDHLTGNELTFSFFYVIPLSLVVILLGSMSGYLATLIFAVLWMGVSIWDGFSYSSGFVVLWNLFMRVLNYLFVVFLVDNFLRIIQELRAQSLRDPLTGAANRRLFLEHYRLSRGRTQRRPGPVTLVFLDIDNFKTINDTLGHAAGDMVLRGVALAVQSQIRADDLLSRLGGDEFVVFMEGADKETAEHIVERILAQLKATVQVEGKPVTFSLGVVTCRSLPEDVGVPIHFADELMYQVKKTGKNGWKHGEL